MPGINIKKEAAARRKKFLFRSAPSAYLMLLPAFVLLTVFVILPLCMALVRAFENYETKEFVGFDNFVYILKTPSFLKSFLNVFLMAVIIVAGMVVLSFFFAIILQKMNNRLGTAAKIVIYVPYLISGIVASIVFLFLTNYGGGLISSVLLSLGKEPISFATEGIWPYVSVIVPTLWLGFGYNTLVMFAGLLNIPKEYYEAAKMDGAKAGARLWYITLPNMKNYFVLIIINLVTANLQMMEVPYIMTGGGPNEKTLTPVLYLFNSFRDPGRPQNVTTAGALLIMLLIMAVNIVVFRLVRSEKSMDA